MLVTKLSSKGQVIIPKPIRNAHHWEIGQELIVIDVGDGVLLRPKKPFPPTKINDVAACLNYSGPTITLEEMEEAIQIGVREHYHDSD